MKVTVVIPNLNGEQLLKPCLDSLCGQTLRDFDVIIVDNGSTDRSLEVVGQYAGRLAVTTICYHENGGFAKAVNEGIRATDSEYVFLLNNDTVVGRHCLEELVGAMEHPGHEDVFSVQALMLQERDRSLVDSAGDYLNIFGHARSLGRDHKASEYAAAPSGQKAYREIFSSCAGAALYRRSAFAGIGFFDEQFFAYLEDVDLGYRAGLYGYRNLLAPQARVLHKGSASSGELPSGRRGNARHNAFKVKLAARNSVLTCYKNMTNVQLWLHSLLFAAGAVVRFLYFACKGLGVAYLEGFFSAFEILSCVERVDFAHLVKGRILVMENKMFQFTMKQFTI